MSETNNRRTTQGAGRSSDRQTSDSRRQTKPGASTQRTASAGRGESGRASSGRPSQGKSTSSKQSSAERILAVQNARNLGSGNSRQTTRNGGSNRGRRKKRRQGPDIAKILLIVIAVIIVLICAAVGLKSCAKGGEEPTESQTEGTTAEPETELAAEITVNGISVNGLTKTEAKAKVMESIGWDMKVSYNGTAEPIADVMEAKVDAVLEEAYLKQEANAYTVPTNGLEGHLKVQVDKLADAWDVQPKNGSISSFNKETNEFVFAGAQNGKMINREKLTADILASIEAGKFKETVEAQADDVPPEISEEQAKAQFTRLGTYTTKTTSNRDRNENVRLASSALNGIIIQPGEVFSMNSATGARTTEKGYKPAGAYLNGVLIEEPGGGVCQVSSTLYNAVVFSGLQTMERHAHSFEPSYVTPGEDAMISFGSSDMKFTNSSKCAIGIKTSFSNQKLTMSIYGTPILEEGVTLSMRSEKLKDVDPPAPTYEEDPTLQPGVEKTVVSAKPGSQWVTYLVTKKNGETVSEEFLHNSSYLGKAATIRRNTSGSVAPTAATTAPESTTAVPSEPESTTEAPTVAPTESHEAGPGFDGPGYEPTTAPSTVRPSEEPGSNILPSGVDNSGPAASATESPTQPAPAATDSPAETPQTSAPATVTMPQTQPPAPVPTEPQTAANPADVSIPPNPANPG